MKPKLLIAKQTFSEVTDDDQDNISYIVTFANSLPSYDKDYSPTLNGLIARRHIDWNQNYINMLFIVTPYLYQYYELESRYFDLLDFAVINLENLYQVEIQKLPDDVKVVAKLQAELSDYLDKVALTFQTAADKAEIELNRNHYLDQAKKYSGKADAMRGVVQGDSHMAKMQRLYQMHVEDAVVGKLFQLRAKECQEKAKCEGETLQRKSSSASSSSSTTSSSPTSPRFFTSSSSDDDAQKQPLLSHRSAAHSLSDPDS